MSKLRSDALKSPVYHIAIIVLLAVGFVSLPLDWLFGLFIKDSLKATLVGGIFIRALLCVAAVVVIIKYKFYRVFFSSGGIKAFIAVIPALLVAVNNFPIIAFLNGNAVITGDNTDLLLYGLYCLSVGAFEELTYCGLVFPLCTVIYKDKRYGAVFSVATTAATFGLSHLVNLFGGAGIGPTVMQIGYSFLIGAMCAITLCVTKNIFSAIILHTVYDIGGLILSNVGVAYGSQWDKTTIIITAVLGVLVAVYYIAIIIKTDFNKIKALYFDGQE